MRVLVTGHLGYLGAAIVAALVDRGHAVSGLDTNLFESCVYDYGDGSFGEATIPRHDVDVRTVRAEHFAGQDAVIHLAGLSNDPLGDLDPKLTYEINHAASVRVAELCKQCGVERLVLASSCSVYGASDEKLLDEGAEFAPVSAYAWSKLKMEQDIAVLADGQFSPVFMRSGTVYGLSPRMRFDLVVNNLMAWTVDSGEIFLKSDGLAWRPIIHLEDVARAFVAMLEVDRKDMHLQAFNVAADSENYQIRDIAAMIRDQIPGSNIVFETAESSDNRNYRVSGSKLESVLGSRWRRYSLEDGIAQLHTALAGTPVRPDEFEGTRYQRLMHLRSRISAGELTSDLRRPNSTGHSV
jgi:nucleoside-diphosphate-sugar epimerase